MRDLIEALVMADEQIMIDPIGVAGVFGKMFHERGNKNVWTVSGLVDSLEVALYVTAA